MPADRSTLVRAILVLAQTKGRPWLVSELSRATSALLAGAPTIKSLSFEGGSATGESEIRTDELVEILTMAVEEFDGDSTSAGMTLVPRISDFSLNG